MNKACQDRCFELTVLRVDPRFETIRSDRRFEAITSQVGLGSASAA